MTPRELIHQAHADGVRITATVNGRLRLRGDQAGVNRWLPIVHQYFDELVADLLANDLPAGDLRSDAAPPQPRKEN